MVDLEFLANRLLDSDRELAKTKLAEEYVLAKNMDKETASAFAEAVLEEVERSRRKPRTPFVRGAPLTKGVRGFLLLRSTSSSTASANAEAVSLSMFFASTYSSASLVLASSLSESSNLFARNSKSTIQKQTASVV